MPQETDEIDLIETLLVERAAIPDNAHEVLHGDRHFGAAVILEHRHVEPHVAVENRLVNHSGLERDSLRQFDFAIVSFFVSRHDDGSRFLRGLFNSAVLVAHTPVVARIVENDDFFRARVFGMKR